MSTKPNEVKRDKALENPSKNRSEDFLPSMRVHPEILQLLSCIILGDRWRVVLKGEVEDYIHAVVVNVSILSLYILCV